jgi:hypothetical protein
VTSLVHSFYGVLKNKCKGDLDVSAVVTLMEDLAKVNMSTRKNLRHFIIFEFDLIILEILH